MEGLFKHAQLVVNFVDVLSNYFRSLSFYSAIES